MNQSPDGNWLEDCLANIPRARVAVFGDFCLDSYWLIDTGLSELSVETSLPVWRVRQQRYSLGGAGNAVANLVDLGIGQIYAIGLIGHDLFGRKMLDLLHERGVKTEAMLRCQAEWQTLVYAKPCIGEVEQNRIDFGGFNIISDDTIEQLADQLSRTAAQVDAVILNQQVPAGVSTPGMIERINAVIAERPNCQFVVDSRDRAEMYQGAMLKLNTHEAARLLDKPKPLDEAIGAAAAADLARRLAAKIGRTVFVTRGDNGIAAADGEQLSEAPGIQVLEQIDPVGAGDTVVAAIAGSLAIGADAATAAKLANIAASITVRKLQTTGTATPDEIRAIGPDPDYVHLPDLAEDLRHARYLDDSEVEIVRALPAQPHIRHAIFDHDGTVSTLRQGWEKVMEPMMVRAILGAHHDDTEKALNAEMVAQVRQFIDKTTGVQTLVQMQGLVELVKQYGYVPKDQICDMHAYKAVFNEALLEMVHERTGKLARSELCKEDFLVKNALVMVQHLYRRGVKLYLASGTDEDDVKAEAEAMGYANFFQGRIFGAVGDVNVEAKRVVMDRIIREHELGDGQFVTFGDGPVEIRETRKRGGIAVGVASHETRRFGLNPAKRTRLIHAGADLIVPDFSQMHRLLPVLHLA